MTRHERYIANKEFVNAQNTKYRNEHKEEINLKGKIYRETHKELVKESVFKSKHKNPELEKERNRLEYIRNVKSNPERMESRRRAAQERKDKRLLEIAKRPRPDNCELCGEKYLGRNKQCIANNIYTVFDHDHVTGKFRGWICNRCNRVLGLIKDDKNLLLAMIKYLSQTNADGGE